MSIDLVVLLRGEAFRSGGHSGSRQTVATETVVARQRTAFSSVDAQLLTPMAAKGYTPWVALYAVALPSLHVLLLQLARASFGERLRATHLSSRVAPTQLQSLAAALTWAQQQYAANRTLGSNDALPHALFVIRADLLLKAHLSWNQLPMPHAAYSNRSMVLAPFQSCDKPLVNGVQVTSRRPASIPCFCTIYETPRAHERVCLLESRLSAQS